MSGVGWSSGSKGGQDEKGVAIGLQGCCAEGIQTSARWHFVGPPLLAGSRQQWAAWVLGEFKLNMSGREYGKHSDVSWVVVKPVHVGIAAEAPP
eukprot:1011161-Pelagomonas_calceolata.AAC.1